MSRSFYKLFFIVAVFSFYYSMAQNKNAPVVTSYNIRRYGAVGDGKHLDHIAINNAISACAKAGGGTVYIPAGNYLCGSVHLKSNIHLYIDAGAVILGAPAEKHAYDTAEVFAYTQYQDGGHTFFHNSLIWGENLSNVSITGSGIINGGGLTSKDKEHNGDPSGGAIETGDKAIALKNCRNVLIRDITIFHGGHFAILATGCDLATFDNLTIDTNRDGIDIDCCTNTLVSNCRVNSPNDDAICPKSSYALNKKVVTENLVITNCEVSGFEEGTLLDGRRIPAKVGWSSGRIKFGTESNGGFKNCVVSNCVFRSCNGLALEEVDGGIMENIIVSNITMQDTRHYPVYITLGKRNRGPMATTGMGTVKNIFISHIIATGADSMSGIQITGTPGYDVENVQLQNIYISYKGGGTKQLAAKDFPELGKGYPEPYLLGPNPAYGLFARHVKGLKISDIKFEYEQPEFRPAFLLNDVKDVYMNHIEAQKENDAAIIILKNTSGFSIYQSQPIENQHMDNAVEKIFQ